ncbi:hypothetical protein Cgig2_003186 [Carnegiea gigantea]|uniref:Uncharacterized protein n=1 Tax=Carnegiea gigantea TaxID=171969 RepID=A0A9Q1JJY0_9CARY|nr:hypothetical protein Cgig2_003186 [Carnegiea gigantea]
MELMTTILQILIKDIQNKNGEKPAMKNGKMNGRESQEVFPKEKAMKKKIKPREKLSIEFYNNRAVGDNYDIFVRHLGIIVHDTHIYPFRNVLSNDDVEVHRECIWDHMHDLTRKARPRNSTNRAYYKKYRLHRTGSKPYRQVLQELYCKRVQRLEIIHFFFKCFGKCIKRVLGIRGGVKPKYIRGPYSTRAELKVVLNATRRKNEVLDHLATLKQKMKNFKLCAIN